MNSFEQPDDYNWKFPGRNDTMYLSKCGTDRLMQITGSVP